MSDEDHLNVIRGRLKIAGLAIEHEVKGKICYVLFLAKPYAAYYLDRKDRRVTHLVWYPSTPGFVECFNSYFVQESASSVEEYVGKSSVEGIASALSVWFRLTLTKTFQNTPHSTIHETFLSKLDTVSTAPWGKFIQHRSLLCEMQGRRNSENEWTLLAKFRRERNLRDLYHPSMGYIRMFRPYPETDHSVFADWTEVDS